MNHKTDSSTKQARLQANVVNTTLQIDTIYQQLSDIEGQVLAAKIFHELAVEQLDNCGCPDVEVINMIVRVSTLLTGAGRAVVLVQQAVENIGHVLHQANEVAA